MITRRERVIKTLQHKETDTLPYQIGLTQQEYEKVAAYLGDYNFMSKLGNHIDSTYYDGWPREELHHQGYFIDDFGVRWNRNGADKDIGVIDGFLLSEASMEGYRFPCILENEMRKQYVELMNNGQDTFKMGAIGFSMFERAWTLRGMENLLTDMLLTPDFVDDLLDQICEYNMKVIDIGLSYDIDGFHFGDDWGQQSGLIMGPKLWRRFIKPRMKRMYTKVKSQGKFVSQHSCGDIHEIFPDLIEIGLDIYQTFQPEIYDIQQIKKQYGQKLTFWGGISTQRLLPFATPDEVKLKVIEIIKVLGKEGGYIIAPTHSIPGDVPPENVIALIDIVQNQKKYI